MTVMNSIITNKHDSPFDEIIHAMLEMHFNLTIGYMLNIYKGCKKQWLEGK